MKFKQYMNESNLKKYVKIINKGFSGASVQISKDNKLLIYYSDIKKFEKWAENNLPLKAKIIDKDYDNGTLVIKI